MMASFWFILVKCGLGQRDPGLSLRPGIVWMRGLSTTACLYINTPPSTQRLTPLPSETPASPTRSVPGNDPCHHRGIKVEGVAQQHQLVFIEVLDQEVRGETQNPHEGLVGLFEAH
ncbi:unnamed protein product [Ectocarpus sp. 12 AP-2014]